MNINEISDGTSVFSISNAELELVVAIIDHENKNYENLDWGWHERSKEQFIQLLQKLKGIDSKAKPISFQLNAEDRQTLNKGISYAAALLNDKFQGHIDAIENIETSLLKPSRTAPPENCIN